MTMATSGRVCPLMLGFGFGVSELDFGCGALGALQRLLQRLAEHGQMAHFAQWRAGGFSVNVNVGAGDVERLLDPVGGAGTFAVAEQVDHDGGGQAHGGRAERPAENGAQMILELRAGAGFDRVMAGVVDARGELVDEDAIVRGPKKFDAECADALDGIDGFAREIGHGIGESGRNCGGRFDGAADVMVLDCFDDGIRDAGFVCAARDHDGEFLRKGAESFGEEGVFFAIQEFPGEA